MKIIAKQDFFLKIKPPFHILQAVLLLHVVALQDDLIKMCELKNEKFKLLKFD